MQVLEKPALLDEHSPVIRIDGATTWNRWFSDLKIYRGALRSLAWRNIRSRYKQALLGASWAFIQPMVQVGVFTVLFGVLAGVPSGPVPYPLFALVALLPWNLFARIVGSGVVALSSSQGIITKLYFPRIYLVIAAGASALIDALVTIALVVGLMAWYDVRPGWATFLAIPALFLVVLLSYGIAAFFAALNARWRDVQHAVPFAIQIGLFVTPVLYHNSFIPSKWRWLLALNPLTGLIDVMRAALLGLPMPSTTVLLTSGGAAMAWVLFGIWYFRRTESTVVDVV